MNRTFALGSCLRNLFPRRPPQRGCRGDRSGQFGQATLAM